MCSEFGRLTIYQHFLREMEAEVLVPERHQGVKSSLILHRHPRGGIVVLSVEQSSFCRKSEGRKGS